jgi:hypothetical protein
MFYAPSVIYEGAHRCAICMWRSKLHTYVISLQNYVGNKQQLYSIMKVSILALLAKAKLDIGSVKGLDLVAVRYTIV